MEVQDFGKDARLIMRTLYRKVPLTSNPFVTLNELSDIFNRPLKHDLANNKLFPRRIARKFSRRIVPNEHIYGFIVALEHEGWLASTNAYSGGRGAYDPYNIDAEVDVYIHPTFKGHTFEERLRQYRIQYWGNIFFMFASPLAVAVFTWFVTK